MKIIITHFPMSSSRNAFLCIIIILLNSFCYGQTTHFSYDANGNREHSWITIDKIDKIDSADSMHRDSIVNNRINSSVDNIRESISLFPNPTQGLLDLKITNLKEGETAEYYFTSLTGQELLRKKTGISITQIDISNFTPGTYIVNVTLGKQVGTWKIVKQ